MSSIMATHLMIKKTMTNQQDNTKNIILIATMILPLISIGLTVPTAQAFDGDFLDDADHDGILDVNDNCVDVANFDQADTDGDGSGDACDLVLNVDGDIKPGDVFVIDDDPLNCDNKGVSKGKSVVPVGIFAGKIDITTILHTGVTINGEAQTEKHGKVHLDDLNEDGFPDIAVLHLIARDVCEVDEIEAAAKNDVVAVTVSGTSTGTPWTFNDSIRVVKPCPSGDCIPDGGGSPGGNPGNTAKHIEKALDKAQKIKDKDVKVCEKLLKLDKSVTKKGIHDDPDVKLAIHDYLNGPNCGGH